MRIYLKKYSRKNSYTFLVLTNSSWNSSNIHTVIHESHPVKRLFLLKQSAAKFYCELTAKTTESCSIVALYITKEICCYATLYYSVTMCYLHAFSMYEDFCGWLDVYSPRHSLFNYSNFHVILSYIYVCVLPIGTSLHDLSRHLIDT